MLNKIRTDIRQEPAGKNQEGSAVYVNLAGLDPTKDITDAALAKAREVFGIDLSGKELKVLFLTHRLIARKAGYEGFGRPTMRAVASRKTPSNLATIQ